MYCAQVHAPALASNNWRRPFLTGRCRADFPATTAVCPEVKVFRWQESIEKAIEKVDEKVDELLARSRGTETDY